MKKNFSTLFFSALVASTSWGATRQVIVETSLGEKSCIAIDGDALHENPEIDFFRSECPGIASYRVLYNGGDLRSNITLVKDKAESVLSLPMTESDFVTFPYVSSENIKWSVAVANFKTYTVDGILFSMSGQDESGEQFKDVSFDVIAKVSGKKACVVAKVKKEGPASDAQALELLNKAQTLKCLQ